MPRDNQIRVLAKHGSQEGYQQIDENESKSPIKEKAGVRTLTVGRTVSVAWSRLR